MQHKVCTNCSAELTCGSKEENCWCMAYTPLTKLDENNDCLCETCLKKVIQAETQSSESPVEQEADYYIENGFYVFTRSYHLKRGHCCKNGCRHCPYGFKK
jgi:hypothetical protein